MVIDAQGQFVDNETWGGRLYQPAAFSRVKATGHPDSFDRYPLLLRGGIEGLAVCEFGFQKNRHRIGQVIFMVEFIKKTNSLFCSLDNEILETGTLGT